MRPCKEDQQTTDRLQEEGIMPPSQVGKIRALLEEGALSKATKLLVSAGLANSQDPGVEQVLRDLHPPPLPHLVAGAYLPQSTPNKLAAEAGEEDEQETRWAKKAWRAITSFPPADPRACAPSTSASVVASSGQGHPWSALSAPSPKAP